MHGSISYFSLCFVALWQCAASQPGLWGYSIWSNSATKLPLSLRNERGRTCGIYCKARAESTEALREKESKDIHWKVNWVRQVEREKEGPVTKRREWNLVWDIKWEKAKKASEDEGSSSVVLDEMEFIVPSINIRLVTLWGFRKQISFLYFPVLSPSLPLLLLSPSFYTNSWRKWEYKEPIPSARAWTDHIYYSMKFHIHSYLGF